MSDAHLGTLLANAFALDREGRLPEAEAAYEAYLARDPFHALAWANLGGIHLLRGEAPLAERACRKALALAPDLAPARVNLAHALLARGQTNQAEAPLREVLAVEPEHSGALAALADLLVRRGEFEAAEAALRRGLAREPQSKPLRDRLHNLAFHRGDWDALRETAERAIDALPPGPSAYERSLWQLLFREFDAGWRNYEARFDVPDMKLIDAELRGPRWRGQPFPERTLLLHWEQGLGDTLMTLRYLGRVKALGGRVVLCVQRPLADLAATCAGVDQVVAHGDPLPPYDLHAFLMSLPGLFGEGPEPYPDPVPYLRVPALVPHRAELDRALEAAGDRPRLGLVWGGNPHHWRNAERSIPGPLWAPLADLPDVAWFGLQLDRDDPPALPGFTDLAPHLRTFEDTAHALSKLDLLITIDSAVGHLAGALGVPAFVLLNFHPDFRWQLHRADTPWYPHTRLYRQPLPGRWPEVIAALRADLGGGADA